MRKYQLFICLILSWQMSNAQIRVAEKNKIPNIDYEIVGNNLRLFGECSDSLKILKSINSLGFQSKMQCIKIYPFRLYRSILFNEVSFKETLFSQKINFSGCTFLMKSNFYYSNFFKDVIFMFSEFKNEVEFSTSKFQNSALFSNSLFNDKANFLSINFNKESGFDNSIFRKVLDFSGSKFDKESDFQGCKFYGNVYFSGCTFLDKINFNNSQFASKANFYYSSFKEAPDFDLVQLPDTLIFTYVNLKNCQEPIRFDFALTDSLQKRNAKNKKCKIFLDNLTDLNKVVLDASKFELSFDKNQNYDKKAGVFEQVIKKCKEMGFQDSEKGFNIEYQKLQLHYKYPIIGSPLILLNEYWWNFGYERGNIFRNTGIAWSISFIIFFLFMPFFGKVYFPTHLSMEANEAIRLKLNSWLRVKIALFYTSLIFFSWKMEHSEVNYRNYPWGALIVYVIFTIGIIHLAYLAGAVINN